MLSWNLMQHWLHLLLTFLFNTDRFFFPHPDQPPFLSSSFSRSPLLLSISSNKPIAESLCSSTLRLTSVSELTRERNRERGKDGDSGREASGEKGRERERVQFSLFQGQPKKGRWDRCTEPVSSSGKRKRERPDFSCLSYFSIFLYRDPSLFPSLDSTGDIMLPECQAAPLPASTTVTLQNFKTILLDTTVLYSLHCFCITPICGLLTVAPHVHKFFWQAYSFSACCVSVLLEGRCYVSNAEHQQHIISFLLQTQKMIFFILSCTVNLPGSSN